MKKTSNLYGILIAVTCVAVPMGRSYAAMTYQEFLSYPEKLPLVKGILNNIPIPGNTLEESQDYLWQYLSLTVAGVLDNIEIFKNRVWLMFIMVEKGYNGVTINDLTLLNHYLRQLEESGFLDPADKAKMRNAQDIVSYKIKHFMDGLIDDMYP